MKVDGGASLNQIATMNKFVFPVETDCLPPCNLFPAMGGCGTGNPIDDCWRCDPNWRSHRQSLANCAIGGKNGKIYIVTNNGGNAQNPVPGTLGYGVTRAEPLWIIFANSMNIQLKAELLMTSTWLSI